MAWWAWVLVGIELAVGISCVVILIKELWWLLSGDGDFIEFDF